MTRRQRWLVRAGIVLASIALLLALGLLLLARTDWGREQVRGYVVNQLNRSLDARVSVDRLEGNLLRRWRFTGVEITDMEDRPFVVADTISTRFRLRSLLRQRLVLTDVRLVHANVVLDHPPGEDWNYARILPERDPDPRRRPGWGSWVRMDRVTIVRSRVTVRSEWRPDPELSPAERERKIAEALGPEGRANIHRVPGGFQNVMDFRRIDARLATLLLADPDVDRTEVEVEALRAIAQPYRPPVADVRDLAGRFYISQDSVWFPDVRARLPDSRLSGSGVYHLTTADLILRLDGAPAAFADLRWLYPRLPEEGGGALRLGMHRRQAATRLEVTDMDVRVGQSELEGDLRMVVGDTFRILPTDLRFARFDSRLLERMIPGLDLPRQGLLHGHLALEGTPAAMRLDGDVAFDDAATGRSRVLAAGAVGVNGELRFSDLDVTARPLRTDLVREWVPRLPPGGLITGSANLSGTLSGPLAVVADLALDDPATGRSAVTARGTIDPRPGAVAFTDFRLGLQPLRAGLVRPELPWLPAGATLAGDVRLHGTTSERLGVDGDLTIRDPATGLSRVGATGGVVFNDAIALRGMDVRLQPLQLDLLRDEVPDLPPGATLAGTIRLDGYPTGRLRVDGELALRDPATGESRIAAAGAVDLSDELVFHGLELGLRPLQVALIRRFQPDLPIGGVLTGSATLNGSPAGPLSVRGDITHVEGRERSRVTGLVELGADDRALVDVRLLPLSLDVAGRFVPAARLHGQVTGDLRAAGRLGDLRFRADLDVAAGGSIAAEGWLDLASAAPGYALDTTLRDFDMAAVSTRAPATTSLTGSIDATGRGLDPATMTATVRADLFGSRVDGVAADLVRLRAEIADGLAAVDSSIVRLGDAEAWLDGRFGLVEGRHGDLRYRVVIDDLEAFESWLPPGDTGVVAPRPGVRRAAIAEARQAVEAAERRRLVEAIATGRVPERQPVPFDTLAIAGIPRDTLAGRFEAAGLLSGNLVRFDLTGRARAEELAVGGQFIGRGQAEFSWLRRGQPVPVIELDAAASRLLVGGIALDSAVARVRHEGERHGTGRAVLAAWGSDDTDVRADMEFTLAAEQADVLIHDMTLRVDTVTWQTVSPSRVSWDGDAAEVDRLELRSDAGGLVLVDGRLPIVGPADLDVTLREVELAHLSVFLPVDNIAGRVTLEARVEGTLAAPTFHGIGILVDGARNGTAIPDLRARFDYGAGALALDAEFFDDGRSFAVAEARLPIDLAITGQQGSRRLPGALRVDVTADSLPLEMLPALTDQVADVEGVAAGSFAISGTWEDAVTTGALAVQQGAFRLAATGVRYQDVAGAFSLEGGTLTVDSLVARAGGTIRVTGEVDLTTLAEPGFNLAVTARNAWAMRSDDLRLRLDADLDIVGPFDRVVVSGAAATRRTVIYIPESRGKHMVRLDDPELFRDLDPRLAALRDDLLDPPSPLLANLEVDVDLDIRPDTWVRSTDINLEIYTPPEVGPLHVQLDQRAGRLTLEGTVNSDRGDYSFMGRRFRVTRGAATFTAGEELDPILQIVAEHVARVPGREEVSIRVLIGGTAMEPTLTLESDARPPVSETDLFTYIALGRSAGSFMQQGGSGLAGLGGPSGELMGNVAGLATQQMAAIAANVMLDEFESEMARELGVDVLHISPADLPAELFSGRFADLLRGTEIEVGRYIGARLFASARVRPTFEARPGATVEYSTPRGYRFTTSYDPRFLPAVPTLEELDPRRTSVFGVLVFREWRF